MKSLHYSIQNFFSKWLLLTAFGFASVPVSGLEHLIEVGDVAPDFTAFDQDNIPFTLSAQAGKVVLINVCKVNAASFQAAGNEAALADEINAVLDSEDWVLVDALTEDSDLSPSDQDLANLWRDASGTPARVLHAEGSYSSDLYLKLGFGGTYGIESFPIYLVVAPDGVVSYILMGYGAGDDLLLRDAVVAAWAPSETPGEQIESLITDLDSENKITGALADKLSAALALLEDEDPNNDVAVPMVLAATMNQIEAQAGKKISLDDAAVLLAAIQAISEELSE